MASTLLQLMDDSLRKVVPEESVACRGDWSTHVRKVYASGAQLGSGAGPFVEVVDAGWSGELSAAIDVSAIAFLATPREVWWVKASLVATQLPVKISLSSFSESPQRGSTLTASVAGAFLPGVRVEVGGSLEDVCPVLPQRLTAGRVTRLAKTSDAELSFVVLPRTVLKVGRNHLWRVRDELARLLPPALRELLTRRRAGSIREPG